MKSTEALGQGRGPLAREVKIGMRALVGIEFSIMCREDLECSITDLMADLLHLARENHIEPDHIIHMAQIHFDAEVEEEA